MLPGTQLVALLVKANTLPSAETVGASEGWLPSIAGAGGCRRPNRNCACASGASSNPVSSNTARIIDPIVASLHDATGAPIRPQRMLSPPQHGVSDA